MRKLAIPLAIVFAAAAGGLWAKSDNTQDPALKSDLSETLITNSIAKAPQNANTADYRQGLADMTRRLNTEDLATLKEKNVTVVLDAFAQTQDNWDMKAIYRQDSASGVLSVGAGANTGEILSTLAQRLRDDPPAAGETFVARKEHTVAGRAAISKIKWHNATTTAAAPAVNAQSPKTSL